jgi:hypothetical protein
MRPIRGAGALHYVLEILNKFSRKRPSFVTSEAWTRDNGINGETCMYGKAIEGLIVSFCCLSYSDIVSNADNMTDAWNTWTFSKIASAKVAAVRINGTSDDWAASRSSVKVVDGMDKAVSAWLKFCDAGGVGTMP